MRFCHRTAKNIVHIRLEYYLEVDQHLKMRLKSIDLISHVVAENLDEVALPKGI